MCDAPMTAAPSPRAVRKSIWTALLHKEWLEQRWRFALGAIVLSTVLAGMLRAQVIPGAEAAVLIYWPVGVMMSVFLAMGPVAGERSDRTWDFLIAQPISRGDVLLAKWQLGLYQLIGIMLIATLAGAAALWSRGLPNAPSYFRGVAGVESPDRLAPEMLSEFSEATLIVPIVARPPISNPILLLAVLGLVSALALACWYTPLFFILSRARNEFAAGLGGIFLTVAVHLWLLQFVSLALTEDAWTWGSVFLNPLAPLVLIWRQASVAFLPILLAVNVVLWIVLPCVIVKMFARKAVLQ